MEKKANTWNVRSYASKNHPPANFNFERNCNQEKVTVWAGLFGSGQIVGPYFFEGNVNGNSYLAMLDEFVVPNIRDQLGIGNNGRFTRGWWIQDGAPAHRARVVTLRHLSLSMSGLHDLQTWPPWISFFGDTLRSRLQDSASKSWQLKRENLPRNCCFATGTNGTKGNDSNTNQGRKVYPS